MRINAASSSLTCVFPGVPFATPPVGDLRWRPAQRPIRWNSTRPATTVASQCTQLHVIPNMTAQHLGSEDCLYLSVYVPHKCTTDTPCPVMQVQLQIHFSLYSQSITILVLSHTPVLDLLIVVRFMRLSMRLLLPSVHSRWCVDIRIQLWAWQLRCYSPSFRVPGASTEAIPA